MPEAKKVEEDVVEVELENETENTEEIASEETTSEEIASEETSDEDLEGYSDKVKKRIEKLTYKMREAERREKAAMKKKTSKLDEIKSVE